jgi:putative RecB family exonuclease
MKVVTLRFGTKGTDMPPLSSVTMRDYDWQMSVYAELYKAKSGQYPARAVLYFLNVHVQ